MFGGFVCVYLSIIIKCAKTSFKCSVLVSPEAQYVCYHQLQDCDREKEIVPLVVRQCICYWIGIGQHQQPKSFNLQH